MKPENKKGLEKFSINTDELPIDDWKKKFKKVKLIAVHTKDGQRHEFVIARPTQSIMDALMRGVNDNKMHKNREVFRNSCVLAGDKEVFDSDMDVQNKIIEKIMDLFDNNLEVEEKEL